MGIGSWLKKWRKREDDEAVQRAQNEYFDTEHEQRMESGDIEGLQADTRAGLVMRDTERFQGEGASADPEERLAQDEER